MLTNSTNKPLEKNIENILRKAVEDEGGVCLKWTCPGHRGVPDRMILFPAALSPLWNSSDPGQRSRREDCRSGGGSGWWSSVFPATRSAANIRPWLWPSG